MHCSRPGYLSSVSHAVNVIPSFCGHYVVRQPTARAGLGLALTPADYLAMHCSELGLHLQRELNNPHSSFRPYLDILPSEADLDSSYETFPPDYLPLLESSALVRYTVDMNAFQSAYWGEHGLSLMQENITLNKLKYASALVTQRYLAYDGETYMVPLLDLANHQNSCPHWHKSDSCPGNPSQRCIIWKAGGEVQRGEEVCNQYGYMTNDEALLQYGFILPDEPPDVFLADTAGFTYERMSQSKALVKPPEFTGTPEELQQEFERLQISLTYFEHFNSLADSWPVSSQDKSGKLLGLLKAWRLERQRALRVEIARLEGLLGGSDSSMTHKQDVAAAAGEHSSSSKTEL